MEKNNLLRSFEVCIGTDHGRDTHRVVAASSMSAYRWALQHMARGNVRLRSLVIKPALL